MIERDASDLHVTVGERPMLRIDGHIIPARTPHILSGKDTLQLAYSVLTEGQKKRFELDDELDFSFGIASLARFRGNLFKQRGQVAMVVRRIPMIIPTCDDLKLPAAIVKFAEKPRGLVLGNLAGSHKSPLSGFAVEFAGHREYVRGDDPKHIDWRLYYKRDKYFIKQYEMETNLVCHLVLDVSASMRYGDGPQQKMLYAAQMATTLGYAVVRQSDPDRSSPSIACIDPDARPRAHRAGRHTDRGSPARSGLHTARIAVACS